MIAAIKLNTSNFLISEDSFFFDVPIHKQFEKYNNLFETKMRYRYSKTSKLKPILSDAWSTEKYQGFL